eukprot:SAG25_NODE_744_length_5595_cov_111.883552_5_plen_90_part_00
MRSGARTCLWLPHWLGPCVSEICARNGGVGWREGGSGLSCGLRGQRRWGGRLSGLREVYFGEMLKRRRLGRVARYVEWFERWDAANVGR